MAQELCYTSAPRGLDPGASGFCTVAVTRGMPEPMVRRLESLSGYRALPGTAPGSADPDAEPTSPIDWAYRPLRIGGEPWCVLSRIAYAGADYSGRPNKFAHHLAARPGECPAAGPAWVLRQPGVMRDRWEGEPALIDELRTLPAGERPPAVCRAWERVTGDAGWAGVLAEAFLLDRSKPAYLIYDHRTTDLLTLLEEAIALLPESVRWSVSFTTYAGQGGAQDAVWRGVVADSPAEAHVPDADAGWALMLDLRRPLGSAGVGRYAEMARLGHAPVPPAAPALPAADSETPEATPQPYELSARPGDPAGRQPTPAPPAPPARAPRAAPQDPAGPRWRAAVWFGWPVVLLAAAGWLVLSRPEPAPPAAAPPQDAAGRMAELESALADRDATIERLRRALDTATRQMPPGGRAAPGPDPSSAGGVSPSGPEATGPSSRTIAPPSPARPGAEPRVEAGPARITPGPHAAAIEGLADHFVADLPGPDVGLDGSDHRGDGWVLLAGLPPGAVVTASGSPAEALPGVTLVPDESGHGAAVVARRVDALGRAGATTLAELVCEAGELRWRWGPGPEAAERFADGAIRAALRSVVVRVRDVSPGGVVLATVQFVGPATGAWTLGNQGDAAILPAGFRAGDLTLAAVSAPRGWTAGAAEAGRSLQVVSRGGAAARAEIVGLGAGSSGQPRVGVVMGWEPGAGPDALASALAEARQGADRLREQASRMAQLMQQRDEAEAELPRDPAGAIDWAAAEADERFRDSAQRWRSARSELEALREEADDRDPSELRAADDAAEARARRLGEALADTQRGGAFTILVVAPASGAVVGRFRVELPDPDAPAPAAHDPAPAPGRAGRRPGGSA